MPDYGCGFMVQRCDYQTQEELLEVAREYKKRRGPPISQSLVADYSTGPIRDWKSDKD